MRFGIPKYRLPRDVLDAEVAAHRRSRASTLKLNTKVDEHPRGDDAEGGFDAAFLAVGAHIAKRAYIPAGEAAKILDAVAVLALDGRRGASRCSAGASSSMAAATPRSTLPAPPSGSAQPKPSSSIAARASRCPRTTSSWRKRSKKAS